MSVVVLGRFSSEQQDSMRTAIARGGGSTRFCVDGVSARWLLGDGAPPPSLILVDATLPDVETFLIWLRGHPRLIGTMVIVVVTSASEHSFIEAHILGADDVLVSGDFAGLTRRVAALAAFDPASRPVTTMGRAVLAHPGEEQRRLIGRVLRLAGFDVAFAATANELDEVARQATPPTMIVASDTLPEGSAQSVVSKLRSETLPELPCVLMSQHAQPSPDGRTMTISEYSPPDNLLFSVNELLRPKAADLRASARLLHAGLCAFRPAGALQSAFALTYNLSREGVYVRTLDALERDTEVWFELRPPRSDRVVHLRGRVAWARKPGKGPGGAVPAGFGLRMTEEACPPQDLLEYQSAYARLCEQQRLAA